MKGGRSTRVVFTIRNKKVRVISARDMNRKEKRIDDQEIEKDTKIDEVVKSLNLVTPAPVFTGINSSRSPEVLEITGFRIKSGMTKEGKADFLRGHQNLKVKKRN